MKKMRQVSAITLLSLALISFATAPMTKSEKEQPVALKGDVFVKLMF